MILWCLSIRHLRVPLIRGIVQLYYVIIFCFHHNYLMRLHQTIYESLYLLGNRTTLVYDFLWYIYTFTIAHFVH